ncbi:Protein CBG26330 [Caenorhabditis briggsae]|uniref:Uncharacterized protein n=2 Tax=Caenorhabditis briggsae TaxID=6238 RepID=A0AAE9AAY3_CAEBR|nr:Protein CBG26330 [Caenorhabditis briggsae]ULT95223.1 hypothetical protein L3Y34_004151 [Caenorhabditis briggsae]CAR98932.1 Protein CBG26330 [Caenorhabditis briggsae]
MRVIFVFLLLIVVLTTADSYYDVKAKIKDLIDDGYGKYNRGKPTSGTKSVSDQDDYGQGRKKNVAWRNSEDDSGDDDDYESYRGNKYDNQKYNDRLSKDQDESSNYRSRSSGSDSNPDSRSSSSSKSDSSLNDENHYKNGKKKGIIGKFMDNVATKLKSIPGKVAAGAAALTGKVVSGVASVPGKVVDGVKSIPAAAKSILPGGKKESGDITLNDYTQGSSEQENHFHVHKDKHYHEEEHRHQDYNTKLNLYNDWDRNDLDEKYGSIYDNMRYKRSVQKSVNKNGQLRKKPSEKRAIVVF